MLTFKQKIIAFIIAISLFMLIIELVRRKRMSEELSVLWLFAGFTIILAGLTDKFYMIIYRLTGIITYSSIVFFFGILFLIIISLQFSIRLTEDRKQIKELAQKIALHEAEKQTKDDKKHE